MTTGPGGGGGTGPGGGSGTGPGRDELVALDSITLLLRTCQLVAGRKLAGADPAARMRLDYALDSARRAVADLQNSGRDGKAAAAVSRPVQHPAGRPPLPGGGFTLPRPPDFKIGVR